MAYLPYGIVVSTWAVEGDTDWLVAYGVAAETAGWVGPFVAGHRALGGDEGSPDVPDLRITLS